MRFVKDSEENRKKFNKEFGGALESRMTSATCSKGDEREAYKEVLSRLRNRVRRDADVVLYERDINTRKNTSRVTVYSLTYKSERCKECNKLL